MRQDLVLVLELYLEQRIWQRLNDHRHYFNCIFLRQTVSFDRVAPYDARTLHLLAFPLNLFRGLLMVSAGTVRHFSLTDRRRRRKVHAPFVSLTKFSGFGKPVRSTNSISARLLRMQTLRSAV